MRRRILQVGLGGWGKNHLRVWSELRQEVFVVDVVERSLQECQVYNIPASRTGTDFRAFLDKVDAVDIVTPTDTHFPVAKACLEAGKDVHVEKPLTLNTREAGALVKLAQEQKRIVQAGHIFRYNPASLFIRDAIRNGDLGAVRVLFGRYAGFKRPRTDVGVLQTDAIHYLDLFSYFLDRLPQRVRAVTRDFLGRGLEDTAFVDLDYGSAIAHVEAGYFPPDTQRDVTVVGDQKTIASDIVAQKVSVYSQRHVKKEGRWGVDGGSVFSPEIKAGEPLKIELESFLRCLESRERPIADGQVGLEALKIVEAAYESSRLRREVEIQW